MGNDVIGVSVDVVSKMAIITLVTYIITGYLKDLSFLAKISTKLEAFVIGLILIITAYYTKWVAGDLFPIFLQYIISSTASIGIDNLVNSSPTAKSVAVAIKMDS